MTFNARALQLTVSCASFLRYDNEANKKVERERNTRSKYMLRNRALLRDSLEVISDWRFCFN